MQNSENTIDDVYEAPSSVFSLRKLSYMNCSFMEKAWYFQNIKNDVWQFDIGYCCEKLMKNPKLRNFQGEMPPDDTTIESCTTDRQRRKIYYKHLHMMKVIRTASLLGHLDCLQVAFPGESKWPKAFNCNAALAHGQLECVKFLRERGCSWSERALVHAAARGDLRSLRYGHEGGIPLTMNVCKMAAKHGHLDCLIYARENNCPWSSATTKMAARFGHLDCLSYACENNCRVTESACSSAAGNGHLHCLMYLREKNYPWDWRTLNNAIVHLQTECIGYAFTNGAPRPEYFS